MTGLEAVALGGLALSAFGALQQGMAEADASNFNRRQAEREAASERDIAKREADDFRRKQSRILATSRARRAGSGITSEGTPLLSDTATAGDIELEAQNILTGGENRARALEGEASLAKARRDNQRIGAVTGAGSTLLTGGAQTFGAIG